MKRLLAFAVIACGLSACQLPSPIGRVTVTTCVVDVLTITGDRSLSDQVYEGSCAQAELIAVQMHPSNFGEHRVVVVPTPTATS